MGRMRTPLSLFRKAQDSLEQSLSAASHEEVHLRQSRFWASTITWALMGTTAFAIGWLAMAKTEEIVVAKGKLEPLGLVNEIQMPVGGVAESILVKAGDHVKAGQVLMRLDTEATLDRRRTLIQGISLKSTELDLKHSELKRYLQVNDTEQAVLARNLALNQEMMQRFDALAKQEQLQSCNIYNRRTGWKKSVDRLSRAGSSGYARWPFSIRGCSNSVGKSESYETT